MPEDECDRLNTGPTGFTPDHGLAVLPMGMTKDDPITFTPFHFSEMTMLEDGMFTTCCNV
jgi:hypothetical protein